jgi:hypothetical protein
MLKQKSKGCSEVMGGCVAQYLGTFDARWFCWAWMFLLSRRWFCDNKYLSMDKLFLRCLFVFVLGFFALNAFSQPTSSEAPLLLLQDQAPQRLGGYFGMSWDPSGTASFEEITQGAAALQFSSTLAPRPSPSAILWLRFELQNQTEQNAHLILRNERVLGYESVEIYRPQLPMSRVDKLNLISTREVYDPQPAFRIEVSPGETQEIFLRLEPHKGWDIAHDPSNEFVLMQEPMWQKQRTFHLIGESAFFVFLLVTALSQLITLAIEPDRSRLWYISLLLSYVVYFGFLSSFSEEFVIPYFSESIFAPVGVSSVVCSTAAFNSSYLDLRKTYPRLRVVLLGLVAGEVMASLVDLLSKNIWGLPLSKIIVPLANTFTGVFIILSITATALRVRDGYRPARFLLAASGVMGLSAVAMAASFVGLIPGVLWGPVFFQMGAVIECLVLSIAVADRLRWIRREKEQADLLLQQRSKEVQSLRTELDYQLVSRSRELTQVLASSWQPSMHQEFTSGEDFEGRYQILKPLGRGGMGSVFMVERVSDRKKLALKLLSGATSGEDAARFTREAEISARMTHPNLVKLFDVGLSGSGAPYIVMELVEGGSLEDERHRFGDVLWALPILSEIIHGLAALHAANIVHRDLKPSNVLLTLHEGKLKPKIADFGISRYEDLNKPKERLNSLLNEAPSLEAAQLNVKLPELTIPGAILGTPKYMPPEAIHGARMAPPAWDIFSLGIMAYEMLTNRAPFVDIPISLALRGRPMPPLSVSLHETFEIPKPIAMIIEACLSSSPNDRPTILALADCFSVKVSERTPRP